MLANKRILIVGNIEAIATQSFRQAQNEGNVEEAANYRKIAYNSIDELLSEGEDVKVSGDADDFHNLAVVFSREDDYETALEIVRKGLTIHKANTDLLADAIKYGSNCGVYTECDEWQEKLNKITKRRWTWRAYSFTIDYLVDSLDRDEEISDEQFEEKKERILNLVKEYQNKFYDLEDSWYSEYDVYWKLNERKKAKEILADISSREELICPKVWLRYADILMDDGQLDLAENMLKRLRQEDTDSAYACYLYGRCRLGRLLKNGDNLIKNLNEETEKAIQLAYRSFALAWRLNAGTNLKERIRKAVQRLYLETEVKPQSQYLIEGYEIDFDAFD